MDDETIGRFMDDGFVRLPGAVDREVVEACVGLLWTEIGLDPADPDGGTEPVRWVGGMSQPPFVDAINAPALLEAS